MKHWIAILFGLSLLLSGCARVKRLVSNPPASSPDLANPTQAPVVETGEDPKPEPALDFASMSFVEKNNLYMQLLTEKINAGLDTSAAENAYQRSLEASLAGDSTTADQALEEAILILMNG